MGLVEQVAAFAAEHLPEKPEAWCKKYKAPKIIHDGLWGTFQLRPHEVALLDTPLLQRLRYLHQTGAVYLTYPSAHHTRFEHTLGVLFQTGRLYSALSESDRGELLKGHDNTVRYAALLHDTGHGPFSHTSEQFYSAHPDMERFQKVENPDLKECGGGEVLSFLIVKSDAFRGFLQAVHTVLNIRLDADEIARTITGTLPIDRHYLSEIVHGPFDADKLDYMPRDGMFSGLRIYVDIDRLYHSISIKHYERNGISEGHLAGSSAGLSPLTQIMFNKMLLYTGMYHHHKVRAVDCMLWAIFRIATEKRAKVGGVQLIDPVQYLRLTDDRLLVPELSDDADITKLINDIRKRRLWKKALTISRSTIPEEMHNRAPDDAEKDLFQGVVNLAGDSRAKVEDRRKLSARIWEEAGKPCQEHEVWLDVPKPPNMNEAKMMWVDAAGQAQPQLLSDFIPIDQWVQLYGTHQSLFHVICPPEACDAVANAAERVLGDEFGLKFLPNARKNSLP
jgi:HD superfamily phosphohydrolase